MVSWGDSGAVGAVVMTGGLLAFLSLLRGARRWKIKAGENAQVDSGERVVASVKKGNTTERNKASYVDVLYVVFLKTGLMSREVNRLRSTSGGFCQFRTTGIWRAA